MSAKQRVVGLSLMRRLIVHTTETEVEFLLKAENAKRSSIQYTGRFIVYYIRLRSSISREMYRRTTYMHDMNSHSFIDRMLQASLTHLKTNSHLVQSLRGSPCAKNVREVSLHFHELDHVA